MPELITDSTYYHVTFENKTHFGEADVEICYSTNPNTGKDSPKRFRFYEIVLTDKRTGESFETDDMPEGLLNMARGAAREEFYNE